MSELLVFAFDNPDGANAMVGTLQSLQKQQLIQLADAAIVVRKPDGKAKVKQLNSLVGAGALGGAFWGMLIGTFFAVFLVPVFFVEVFRLFGGKGEKGGHGPHGGAPGSPTAPAAHANAPTSEGLPTVVTGKGTSL